MTVNGDQADLIEQVLGEVVEVNVSSHPAAAELAAVHAREIASRQAVAKAPEHGAVIRPGDVLIVGGPATLTHREAAELKATLLARLPGIADVIVMPGLSVEGIYRTGAP